MATFGGVNVQGLIQLSRVVAVSCSGREKGPVISCHNELPFANSWASCIERAVAKFIVANASVVENDGVVVFGLQDMPEAVECYIKVPKFHVDVVDEIKPVPRRR